MFSFLEACVVEAYNDVVTCGLLGSINALQSICVLGVYFLEFQNCPRRRIAPYCGQARSHGGHSGTMPPKFCCAQNIVY